MLQVTTVNMHCEISIYCDSFIYKIPMHRKKVRLRCYYFCVLFFLFTRFQLDYYFDWLESTMRSCYLHENTSQGRRAQFLSSLMSFNLHDQQVSKPSYMAIKKALYGRQPGCFSLDFLCVLLL